MSELKQLPEPIDIDHQIENLKEIGLVEKYNGVDVTTMGFPNDWKKYLVIDD